VIDAELTIIRPKTPGKGREKSSPAGAGFARYARVTPVYRILREEMMIGRFAKLATVCAFGTAVLSTAAFAGDSTPRVDQRQDNQKARIHQGIESGELTRHEAHNLVEGQHHVNRIERRATADGAVTAKERLRLEQAQDHQSDRTYRLKHNNRDRD
jgi:hypothetical protein